MNFVLRGAQLIDGTGVEPRRADVVVRDGRIAGIGESGGGDDFWRADDLGTVAIGKLADLIAVDFDPLTEPALFDVPDRVRAVIKNGTVVKDTR